MQKHRDVLQQASRLAVAVALCIAAMLAVYALTGHFTNAVLLGALIGFVMAMGNFLSLSITVSNAMNRAANGGSPQKAQLEIQTSSVVRPVTSCCWVKLPSALENSVIMPGTLSMALMVSSSVL